MHLSVRAMPHAGVHPEQAEDSDVVPGLLPDFADDSIGRMFPMVHAPTRRSPSTIWSREAGQQDRPIVNTYRVRAKSLDLRMPIGPGHPMMLAHMTTSLEGWRGPDRNACLAERLPLTDRA